MSNNTLFENHSGIHSSSGETSAYPVTLTVPPSGRSALNHICFIISFNEDFKFYIRIARTYEEKCSDPSSS